LFSPSLIINYLVHLADKVVDVPLPVAELAALDEGQALLGQTPLGCRELEGPEELVGLLEGGTRSDDLVDEILSADDSVLAEVLLDDRVVGDGDPLPVDAPETPLVHKLTDGLDVGSAEGDEGGNKPQHVDGSGVDLKEHPVVDL
jgi:hypothetical protein